MTLKLLSPILILANLTACGGGSDGGSPDLLGGSNPPPNLKTSVNIEKWTIASQSDADVNNTVTEINANLNQGAFEITWAVNVQELTYKTDTYVAPFFLSDDANFTLTEDFSLHAMVCGSVPNVFCTKEGKLACAYSTKNYFECAVAGRTVLSTNVAYSLDALPKSIFVIMQACNMGGTETICQEQAQPVTFQ